MGQINHHGGTRIIRDKPHSLDTLSRLAFSSFFSMEEKGEDTFEPTVSHCPVYQGPQDPLGTQKPGETEQAELSLSPSVPPCLPPPTLQAMLFLLEACGGSLLCHLPMWLLPV